jgi:O-antigen biosynthesis protein
VSAPRRSETISVVIPCHNYGAFLSEALTSVLEQTYPPDEIVVVNDGSTDSTAAEIDRWTAVVPGLRSLQRHPARGAATTFNDGVAASTGDLVTILSADDRFSARYLELLSERLEDPSVDFAYAGARTFGAEEAWKPAAPFDVRELARENFINGSALFRRAVHEKTGGYQPQLDSLGLEDWELYLHAVALGFRGVAVDGCWLDYRRHERGSRNTISRRTALRAHLTAHRLHPDVVRRRDLLAWAARSIRRNIRPGPTRVSQPVAS